MNLPFPFMRCCFAPSVCFMSHAFPTFLPGKMSLITQFWWDFGGCSPAFTELLVSHVCSLSVLHPIANTLGSWCLEWSDSWASGFPGGASGKETSCQCCRCKRHESNPWIRKIPWRRAWQPTPVFLPGESYGQRSLPGYSIGSQRVEHERSSSPCTHTGHHV